MNINVDKIDKKLMERITFIARKNNWDVIDIINKAIEIGLEQPFDPYEELRGESDNTPWQAECPNMMKFD